MDRKYLSLSVIWMKITLICILVSSSGLMLTNYYNTANAPEVAYNQEIRQIDKYADRPCDRSRSRRPTLCSKTLVFRKDIPSLICYI